jgi:DNA-binding NarL/FixJ family response regulator
MSARSAQCVMGTMAFSQAQLSRLTVRQRQVFELLDEGLTVADVSRRLGLASSTVREHVTVGRNRLHAGHGWIPSGRLRP